MIVLAAYDLSLCFQVLEQVASACSDITKTVLQIHIRMSELLLIFNPSKNQLKKIKLVDNSYFHFYHKEVRSLSASSYFLPKISTKVCGKIV